MEHRVAEPLPVDTNGESQAFEYWLKLARANCDEALSRCLTMCLSTVIEFSRRRVPADLRNRFGDSDLAQETLLNAQQSFLTFRGETKQEFISWLREISRNRIRNFVRDHRRCKKRSALREERLSVENVIRDNRLPSAQSPPLSGLDSLPPDEWEIMDQSFASLPPHFQRVIELRSRRGLSFEQIAAENEENVSTVRRRWSRAIEKWRELVVAARAQ